MRFFSTVVTCLLSISAVWSLPVPSGYGMDGGADRLFNMINNYRARANMPSLNRLGCLDTFAQSHNADLDPSYNSYKVSTLHHLSQNICESSIPSNVKVIDRSDIDDPYTVITGLIDDASLNNGEMSKYNYVGFHVSLLAGDGYIWTIALA